MIEEKIAKFRDLLAKRDEIDAEIAALFGEGKQTSVQKPASARGLSKRELRKMLKVKTRNRPDVPNAARHLVIRKIAPANQCSVN